MYFCRDIIDFGSVDVAAHESFVAEIVPNDSVSCPCSQGKSFELICVRQKNLILIGGRQRLSIKFIPNRLRIAIMMVMEIFKESLTSWTTSVKQVLP